MQKCGGKVLLTNVIYCPGFVLRGDLGFLCSFFLALRELDLHLGGIPQFHKCYLKSVMLFS